MRKLMGWVLALLILLPLAALVAGRLGVLTGSPAAPLGVRDGLLSPPSTTPNSVSSQAQRHAGHPMREAAHIDALPWRGDTPATLAALRQVVEAMPGAAVVRQDPDGYLYATFTTQWLRFVDDVEFWVDRQAGVVHVRSASRIGRKDFGVNRARVEAIRAALNPK